MLSKFDDFPIHQTSEPLMVPNTSDRNFYNRTWFNGYAPDGSFYFGIGIAIYPHRGIMDCAFSVVRPNEPQYCFFGSRKIPSDLSETIVGPFELQISSPMRSAKVSLKSNISGLSCELMFDAKTQPIQEARQVLWSGTRRVMDATRFAQFGQWNGEIKTPSGKIEVIPSNTIGTKDRSWGVRNVGEPEFGGAPKQPGGICFIWAPLVWKDHVSHAIFFDDKDGQPIVREGLEAPLYEVETLSKNIHEDILTKFAASHSIEYEENTRWAKRAEISLTNLDGDIKTISLEPRLRFMMKGLGYGHPEWKQGVWKGNLEIGHDCFELDKLDPLSPENLHIQQVVGANDGGKQGVGVLEQIIFGPYAPAGFKGFNDGFSKG